MTAVVRLALVAVLVVLVGVGSLYAYRAQGPESPQFTGVVLAQEAEQIFDPGLVSSDPSGTYNGIDAFLGYVQGYLTAAPDSKINLEHIVEAGDLVIVEGKFTGTNTGPLASPQGTMPASGKAFVLPYADVFEIKNGKIAKHRTYFDQMAFLGQLALLPAPAKA